MTRNELIEQLQKHRENDVKIEVADYDDSKPEDYYDDKEPLYLAWDILSVRYDPDQDVILVSMKNID